jgi:uncharacterized membrane protein
VFHDDFYDGQWSSHRTVINTQFLSTTLFCLAFGAITFTDRMKQASQWLIQRGLDKVVSAFSVLIFLLSLYALFFIEINLYWEKIVEWTLSQSMSESRLLPESRRLTDLYSFQHIWLMNYTLFFISSLMFLSIRRLNSRLLASVSFFLLIAVFLEIAITVFPKFSSLRYSFTEQMESSSEGLHYFNLIIRYITYILIAGALWVLHLFSRSSFAFTHLKEGFSILLNVSILFVGSSEIIHWMELGGQFDGDKYALTVFWGVYALLLVFRGIGKELKQLRIMGIALLGITLIKLFFYDISNLSTLAKTVVFIVLGALILLVSFLYNRNSKNT